MKRSEPLQRKTPLRSRSQPKKRSGFTPASKEQRESIEGLSCIVTGLHPDEAVVDFAHLCARAQGGCDDPLCGVPLARAFHRSFDDGGFDLLPFLVPHYSAQIAHALEHYNGDLIALLQRLTGTRWQPVQEAA